MRQQSAGPGLSWQLVEGSDPQEVATQGESWAKTAQNCFKVEAASRLFWTAESVGVSKAGTKTRTEGDDTGCRQENR